MTGASMAATDVAVPAARRALLRRLNGRPWAGEVRRWACHSVTRLSMLDAVVAIPARDESARIESCLDACARSIASSGSLVGLLVLVNGTSDTTTGRTLAWAARHRRPITLIEVDFAEHLAHAGAARRLALELASAGVGPETALLSTDADARPGRRWVTGCLEHLRGGATLVCGRTVPAAAEARRLPSHVVAIERLERRYRRASFELEHLIDPDPLNPWPHHGEASGASLAIRARDLVAVGGVPLVRCGEDRALVRRVRAHGLTVVHADDVEVEVSCRMAGRASGGMADTLRRRSCEVDSPCDEALESAAALRSRLLARARLRALWPARGARLDALVELGADASLADGLARIDRFEPAWDGFESDVLAPSRTRLRTGTLREELATLLALVKTTRRAGRTTPRPSGGPRHVDTEQRDGSSPALRLVPRPSLPPPTMQPL